MIRSKSKFINRETTDSERDSVDKANVRVGRDLKITLREGGFQSRSREQGHKTGKLSAQFKKQMRHN